MADYTLNKTGIGAAWEENAVDSEWADCQPLPTPDKVRTLHLFGLPLRSFYPYPDGTVLEINDEDIKLFIEEAVTNLEAEMQVTLVPRQYEESHDFDAVAYREFGYFSLRHTPVVSVQQLTVRPPDKSDIFRIPLDWIDVKMLAQGQMNIIPWSLYLATGFASSLTSSPVGVYVMSLTSRYGRVPNLWNITYTAGFPNGNFPKVINQLIGIDAAINILSALQATNAQNNAQSLSIDGLSQSVSNPGAGLYKNRLDDLMAKREKFKKAARGRFNKGIIVDYV